MNLRDAVIKTLGNNQGEQFLPQITEEVNERATGVFSQGDVLYEVIRLRIMGAVTTDEFLVDPNGEASVIVYPEFDHPVFA